MKIYMITFLIGLNTACFNIYKTKYIYELDYNTRVGVSLLLHCIFMSLITQILALFDISSDSYLGLLHDDYSDISAKKQAALWLLI